MFYWDKTVIFVLKNCLTVFYILKWKVLAIYWIPNITKKDKCI